MRIQELVGNIVRQKQSEYPGGSRNLQIPDRILRQMVAGSKPTDIKLKNGKTAMWAADPENDEMRVIVLLDPPASKNERPIPIGRLILKPVSEFPIGYAYQVSTINVHEGYRLGQGQLSTEMYKRVLMPKPNGLNGILLAGGSQTQGGRAAWFYMPENIPGAEVSAYLTVDVDSLEPKNNANKQEQSYAVKFIEEIMNIGGIYRDTWINPETNTKQAVYDFPVRKGNKAKELEPLIKSKISAIYTGEFNTRIDIRYGVGLMAKWIGQNK